MNCAAPSKITSKLCGTAKGATNENGTNAMQISIRRTKQMVIRGKRMIFAITEYNGKLWKKYKRHGIIPICADAATAIAEEIARGSLHFLSVRIMGFEKQAMPKTEEKLIKKLASKSANGDSVIMNVKASERLFSISERCPFIIVIRQTELIIIARITEGENPTNMEYNSMKMKITGTRIFALKRLVKREISATIKPICSPETAKICPMPAMPKYVDDSMSIPLRSPVIIPNAKLP